MNFELRLDGHVSRPVFISYWARIRQGSVCIWHETTALLSAGHLFRAYSAHFQALRLCPALDWKIVSMQILLREGFHSLRHNLPPGSPTFFLFFSQLWPSHGSKRDALARTFLDVTNLDADY